MASNKPIIAIGSKAGDAAKILTETKSGTICDFNDSDCVASIIKELYKKGIVVPNINEAVHKYSRENITKTLSNIINRFDT